MAMPQGDTGQSAGAAGAAGTAGAGAGAPGAAGTPAGLTLAEVEELLKAQENRSAAGLRKALDEEKKARAAVEQRLADIADKLEQRPGTAVAPAGGQDHQETEAERQARIDAAKREDRIKGLEARLADAEAKREEEAKARSVQEERQAAADALAAGGVDVPRLKGALALLREDGRIVRNEQGQVCLKLEGKYGPETPLIADGIKAWLETPEGKAYLPPRSAAGSGASARPGASGAQVPKDPKEAARIKLREEIAKSRDQWR